MTLPRAGDRPGAVHGVGHHHQQPQTPPVLLIPPPPQLGPTSPAWILGAPCPNPQSLGSFQEGCSPPGAHQEPALGKARGTHHPPLPVQPAGGLKGDPSPTHLPPPAQPHTPPPRSTAPSSGSSIPTHQLGIFKDLGLGVNGSQLALMGSGALLGLGSHWQPHTWGWSHPSHLPSPTTTACAHLPIPIPSHSPSAIVQTAPAVVVLSMIPYPPVSPGPILTNQSCSQVWCWASHVIVAPQQGADPITRSRPHQLVLILCMVLLPLCHFTPAHGPDLTSLP